MGKSLRRFHYYFSVNGITWKKSASENLIVRNVDRAKKKCSLQSVSKVMTHLTVFGEFSSIPNLGKTSPPPPCKMLTRHEMTIVPERVINIDWGGRGKIWQMLFFLAVVRRSSRKFQNFAECVTSFATDCMYVHV